MQIYLDFPTVGGTENILMVATLADGITTIHNAAREPEVVDLVRFYDQGSQNWGEGSSVLRIDGVPALRASRTPFSIMGDRISERIC